MRHHADAAGVQEYGCGALWNLAYNAANKVTIAGVGGIDVVVAAMRHHADAAGVQERGCGVLRSLAANAASKAAIIRVGGRDVVEAARRRHGSAGADGALEALRDDVLYSVLQFLRLK
jgi:dihydroorotate dehydrogenase